LNKVDKVTGKGLSTEDYTASEKSKLSGIQSGAEVNVQSDWNQTDNAQDDFIKNKPTIPDVSGKLPYTIPVTGSNIDFATPKIYNSPASPSSSNLTNDLTGASIGVVQKIYSNKAVGPTYPAGWVKVGTGTYTTGALNIIFVEWVSGTRCEYWITKPAS
jgi:hypothetical protein